MVEFLSRSGEMGRSSLGAFMQTDVKIASQTENTDRKGVSVRLLPDRFFDTKVPQRAKVMLQFRKSIVNAEFVKCRQNAPIIETGVNVSASHGDKYGKGYTVTAMGDVLPKAILR